MQVLNIINNPVVGIMAARTIRAHRLLVHIRMTRNAG